MLDNLRNQPETGQFQETEEEKPPLEPPRKKIKIPEFRTRRTFDQVTGTSAVQRFVLAMMLFLSVCLLGLLFLVLTGKIVPSFLF